MFDTYVRLTYDSKHDEAIMFGIRQLIHRLEHYGHIAYNSDRVITRSLELRGDPIEFLD